MTNHFPSLARYAHLLYCEHAVLRFAGKRLPFDGACGGAQGCNMAGPSFCVAIQDHIVLKVKERFGLELNLWYADDNTFAGKIMETHKASEFLITEGPKIGVVQNLTKSVVFFPCSLSGLEPICDPFPKEMKRAKGGIVCLGTPIGNAEFTANYLKEKIDVLKPLLTDLKSLPVHAGYHLLKTCSSFGKVAYRLRTASPIDSLEVWKDFDLDIQSCLADILAIPELAPYTRALMSLCAKHGGLGMTSTALASPAAYIASFTTCNDRIEKLGLHRLQPPPEMATIVQLLNSSLSSNDQITITIDSPPMTQHELMSKVHSQTNADLIKHAPTPLDAARHVAHQMPHSATHLSLCPTPERTFSDEEMITLLKIRLNLPVYAHEKTCPKCKKDVCDVKANHALCCLGDVDKIAIHNTVASVLGKELIAAGYRTRFEVSNLKLSPHTNDRPADLYAFEFERHLGAAFDVTVHSPTAFHNIRGTLAGPRFDSIVPMPNYAAAVAEQEKFQRYAYLNDRHFIRPLCFQSNGGWNQITQDTIVKLAQRSCKARKLSFFKNLQLISERLAFNLMKVIANAVLSRKPVTYNVDAPRVD